jgi:serine/threonine protein phosphatase PrpC
VRFLDDDFATVNNDGSSVPTEAPQKIFDSEVKSEIVATVPSHSSPQRVAPATMETAKTPIVPSQRNTIPIQSSYQPVSNVTFFSPSQVPVPATPMSQSRVTYNSSTPSLPYTFNFNLPWQSPGALFSPSSQIQRTIPQVESEELRLSVMDAASETALVQQLSSADFNRRYELVRQIQDKKHNALKISLENDPSLSVCRLADMGGLATDGFTPLHLAAQYDNLDALEVLVSFSQLHFASSESATASQDGIGLRQCVCWMRDLQGRTPLHIAAMHNSVKAATWLRRQMRIERAQFSAGNSNGNSNSNSNGDLSALNASSNSGKEVRWSSSTQPLGNAPTESNAEMESPSDPVGFNAPIDLGGLTPLGCGKLAASKKRAKPLASELQQSLFSPGDRSVLPRTPKAGNWSQSRPSTFASPAPVRSTPSSYPYQSSSASTPSYYNTDTNRDPAAVTNQGNADAATVSLVYAVGEAQGWTNGMEDRHFCVCPLSSVSSTLSTIDNANAVECGSWSVFGVLDGHGGSFSSDFLARHLPETIVDTLQQHDSNTSHLDAEENLKSLLTEVCRRGDARLAAERRMSVVRSARNGQLSAMDTSGATGLLLVTTQQFLAVANVGDCRAVLARRPLAGAASTSVLSKQLLQEASASDASDAITATKSVFEAVALSSDHKPSLPEEQSRIIAAGVSVSPVVGNETVFEISDSTLCPGHKLRVARAFGDFFFKQFAGAAPTDSTVVSNAESSDLWSRQAVTACPDVRVVQRDSSRDVFVVLACDGVWDVFDNQEMVDFLSQHLRITASESEVRVHTAQVATACEALLEECLRRGSRDNMTVFLIFFQPQSASPTTHQLPQHIGLLVHGSGSSSASTSLPTMVHGSSAGSGRAGSPRHYHTDYLLPVPTHVPARHPHLPTSRKSSPRISFTSHEAPSEITSNNDNNDVAGVRRTSFVRDPALYEVDVPQPPPSVLQHQEHPGQVVPTVGDVSSNFHLLRAVSDIASSPSGSQFPASPPPVPLYDGNEPGIMSPLCSAPRSSSRNSRSRGSANNSLSRSLTQGNTSHVLFSEVDDSPTEKKDMSNIHDMASSNSEDEEDDGDLSSIPRRVERQLHF